MKPAELPPSFAGLAGRVRYVRQVSATEYCGSCPRCGDSGHRGSDAPDRFRMFDDGHPTGWCRRCGYLWFPDMANPSAKPTPEQFEAWRRARLAEEEARKRSAERAIAHLQSIQLWERYHLQLEMQSAGRAYWRKSGVPDSFQDWWRLGWDEEHPVWMGDHEESYPAATIPIFDNAWQAQDIKYRILGPDNVGRYRYEVAGSGIAKPPFLCNPDVPLGGHTIAIEGEKKAMVTFVRLDDANACIIGLPGTNPSAETVARLRECERVTLVMDPDAKVAGVKLARQIGLHRARLLVTPVKIDDGILERDLGKHDVERLLQNAVDLRPWVKAG